MKKLHIACLGDSLTYGYGVRREETWVFLAGRELTPDVVLHNHGLNGDTTIGMLERLHSNILPARPGVVLLMGGANDIALEGSWTSASTNMPIMIRNAAAESIIPLVGIPLPFIPPPHSEMDSHTDWAKAAAEYDHYAHWLRGFCSSSGVQVVDFRACFEEDVRCTGDTPGSYFFDGLHFAIKGHQVLATCMTENTRALFTQKI